MAQTWTSLPTPPDSPRRRRQQLRESEEVTGTMSIEQYLDRTDSYRSTSLQEPAPLPLRTEPANSLTSGRVLQLEPQILMILESHNFPPMRMLGKPVVQVVDKPGYSDNCKATVLRIMYRNIVIARAMGPAKDELVQLLRHNQILDVEVDIIDIEKCFRPCLFAISAGSSAVTRYEECRPSMIAMLNSTLHEKWTTMSLYETGSDKARAMPTIVVTVQPRTTHDWHRLLLELRDLQQTARRLPVEFLPGKLCHLAGNSQFMSMHKDGSSQMGDSITVAGERGGGTLGIFTILKYGHERHTGFLTNFHVVSPAKSANVDTKAKAYRRGSSLSVDDHTSCEVIRFAPKDIEETVINGLERLEELNAELLKLRQEKYYREMAVCELPRHLASSIDRYEALVTLHQKKIDLAMSMPTTIGELFISSGNTIWNNRVIDWAFVKIDEGISFEPNVMPRVPKSIEASRYGLKFQYEPGDPLTGFGVLTAGEWYCKVGKATGLTAGICNGTKVSCHWNNRDRQRFDFQGNAVIVSPEVTEEYVVVDQPGDHFQRDFAHPGDSGSVLIDRFGRVCGLLYGATYTYAGVTLPVYAGLAMTMSDVFETIKLKSHHQDAVLELP